MVSYRAYFDGELLTEVPHRGDRGKVSAEISDVTPGVPLTTRLHSVSNFGVVSDPAEAVGAAPFDDED